MFVKIHYSTLKYQQELKWTRLLSLIYMLNPAQTMSITSQMQYAQTIFAISSKYQKNLIFHSEWHHHPFSYSRQKPGNYLESSLAFGYHV